MIGWCKAGALKNYLVNARITNRDNEESKSAQSKGNHCYVCQYIEKTGESEDADKNKYDIRKEVTNCNTDFTGYKFHCRKILKFSKKIFSILGVWLHTFATIALRWKSNNAEIFFV